MSGSPRHESGLRPLTLRRSVSCHAEGSCLVSWGNNRVFVTATVEERVPPFLRGQGTGWVTAEYAMLPRATVSRSQRESVKGKQSGRSQEISRLIGRSLRAVVDLAALGERQIILDCDVLQADGGTRCAAITGAWVALAEALSWLKNQGLVGEGILKGQVAAVSVGLIDGQRHVDLDYELDSRADVDMNVVMNDRGDLIEVQGTGERAVFSRAQLNGLLDGAEDALRQVFALQRQALEAPICHD